MTDKEQPYPGNPGSQLAVVCKDIKLVISSYARPNDRELEGNKGYGVVVRDIPSPR